ncbi:sec-independent protein translocase protein TatA [Thermoflavifilum aggregans]|uniref:Sec-independent protein translocase protein TatA n=1 Tax=Thermoflavifilum aggregans TaxID=454188 RepID=A0A2M9CXF3_9BACT|nr:twin-arginine translocase TatA/TatE family subunit [Thermoflavifilum aggregans]PJJ76565.1 sec-independent protein translocase protein TatA [Thermoflavifilum aggregans]
MLHNFAHGDLLMLFSEGHLFVIALIALLLFGGKKIPELMRGLGSGIREFNDAKNNVRREIEDSIRKDATATPTSSQPTSNPTVSSTNPSSGQ